MRKLHDTVYGWCIKQFKDNEKLFAPDVWNLRIFTLNSSIIFQELLFDLKAIKYEFKILRKSAIKICYFTIKLNELIKNHVEYKTIHLCC